MKNYITIPFLCAMISLLPNYRNEMHGVALFIFFILIGVLGMIYRTREINRKIE